MRHKFMILFSILILFSLLVAPAGTAQAQSDAQDGAPECPPYKAGFLQEKGFLDSLTPECISTYKEAARQDAMSDAADVEVLAVGGPDTFGYIYKDTVAFSWIDATTNSGLTGDDRSSGLVNIGFSFPFYGTPQTQLYFNTNGLITFGAGTNLWGAYPVPSELSPNNFIAAFWDDLLVGSPYNSGGIYYARGGSAPNRYFVIEWRNIENYAGTGTFSFEAILYEKGDILILHKSRPSAFFSTVGIEDATGYQGLQYQFGSSGINPPKAIRFFYPTAHAARILVYPLQRGGFVPLTRPKNFSIVVMNTGNLGTDTYDLTLFTSSWPVAYYAANGTTPLTDTDGDFMIDTGPIPVGGSKIIVARYEVLQATRVGDSNVDQIQFTSSLNTAVTGSAQINMSVPAGFASVLVDNANGAMSFFTASSGGTNRRKATADNYFGSNIAVARLTDGNYFYAWDKGYPVGSSSTRDIEYVIVNRAGGVVRAASKLTNNASASMQTLDSLPSIAVAPDGTVGVVWRRYVYDSSKSKFNYNIIFATLNTAGTPLSGLISITNNTEWGDSNSFDIPQYFSPTIAATSDNRFVMAWEDDQRANSSTYTYNIWLAVRTTGASSVRSPTDLTSDDKNRGPILNSLVDGRVIVTWLRTDSTGPYYAVLNSGSSIYKSATNLASGTSYGSTDAVRLPNGKVAVAWATGSGVQFSILNSSYNIETGPHTATSPSSIAGRSLSVTTDSSSRVIMTWIDRNNSNKQLYALGTSDGGYITLPMVYNSNKDGLSVSWNGEGNAPFQGNPVISGNAGVAGATLTYTGGSTNADSNGDYAFQVPFGWSGTVTPSKAGYIFAPTKRTYSNVTTDQTAQNYTATRIYFISGNVGVAGVKLSFTDGIAKTVLSKQNGNYKFAVSANWSGTVTPTHPCFTFSPPNRSYPPLTSSKTAQDYTPSVKAGSGCADVDVNIGGTNRGRYGISPAASARVSFIGVESGPVEIASNNAVPLIGAERVIYRVDNIATSFSETMALPNSQVDTVHWLPWYTNNPALNTQLRIANVSGSNANVQVTIGGVDMGSFPVLAGAVALKSYPGINKGPVKIESNQDIVVSEQVIYTVNGKATSYSETLALPAKQLDTLYWFPWYSSEVMSTELWIGNASNSPASVRVWIGGDEMPGGPFSIPVNGSRRLSFPDLDAGPVKIESTGEIVASERVVYKVAGIVPVSFSETMALPNKLADPVAWLPWYNSKTMGTQLRITNVSQTDASVHVFIGGVEMSGSPFTVPAETSVRKNYPGIDAGLVQIVSNQDIVVGERILYEVNGTLTSFSEILALPDGLLDTISWLPWYNNKTLATQIWFGNP